MTALTFPLALADFWDALQIAELTLELGEASVVDETGRGEVLSAALGARLWQGSATIARRVHDAAGRMEVLVDLIRQPGATVLVSDPRRPGPRSDPQGAALAGYSPVISAVSADRREITITGAPPSYTLSPGDWLSFDYGTPARRALHRIVRCGTGTAGGTMPPAEVIPAVRPGASAGAAITLLRPTMRALVLPGSVVPARSVRGLTDGLSFRFIQTLAA